MSGSLNDIRSQFLNFFAANDHKIVSSAPLVPETDPTLLFTNAGMVPFKDVFTGKRKPQAPRIASAQKCIRAGGKHNDLDNVGYTARHHTFFEMLGNFSFGDYFKEQAIHLAWKFLTEELALSKSNLLITVFDKDEEAFALWKKISGFRESQIIKISTSDNFWSMGQTGPCGPCSEIFYDHGEDVAGGPPSSADEDGDRFVEIWNLVFMQFERTEDGSEISLPRPSIDTGLGLERVSAVMQGLHNNYEIDIFKNIIAATETLTHIKANTENLNSFRVIADHIRSIGFLLSDGILPSNEGRGYVLRRILRRAMRHLYLLGYKKPALYKLIAVLESEMGKAYPELTHAKIATTQTLKNEEERFADMLERGMGLLEKELANLTAGEKFSGEVAFKLYDTYGFPLDLTQDALRLKNFEVDVEQFNSALKNQRDAGRLAWKGSGDLATEDVFLSLVDNNNSTKFLGYLENSSDAKVLAVIKNGEVVDEVKEGEAAAILLDQTPFYAESGGQVGDSGTLIKNDNCFKVEDTKKQAGSLHIHYGTIEKGKIKTGDNVSAKIDVERRTKIRANHSATHLMNAALIEVLGAHVSQKGSLVDENHLRFDFSHNQPFRAEEIVKIENLVNAQIRANVASSTKEMPQDEARQSGAIAMFGEKYDDIVRVLFMGEPSSSKRAAFSIEFCGGTHVSRTGDIALFKITGQSAVGAGVRRVIGLTRAAAFDYMRNQESQFSAAAAVLKIPPQQLQQRLEGLVEENKKLSQGLRDTKRKLALAPSSNEKKEKIHIETIGAVKFLPRIVEDMDIKDSRKLVDDAKRQLGSGVVALLSLNKDKGNATLMVGVSKDLTDRHDAVVLVKMGAALLGGSGGGGRADMAQAGGPDGTRAKEAIEAVREALR